MTGRLERAGKTPRRAGDSMKAIPTDCSYGVPGKTWEATGPGAVGHHNEKSGRLTRKGEIASGIPGKVSTR